MELASAEALAIQNRAEAACAWIMWFIGSAEADFPGKVVAWAVIANSSGGLREPGYLVADTLTELRAMLPGGLTRRDRTAVMLASVIETWD